MAWPRIPRRLPPCAPYLAAVGVLCCASPLRAEPDEPSVAATADPQSTIPDPAQLEEFGARIGRVEIETRNIFDLDNPEENKALYRWANDFHVVTRPRVIRGQLLFAEGGAYAERLLEESERLLRENEYLGYAEIEPVAYRDGVVDLKVTTTDVWSLSPDVSLSRSGGETVFGIGAREQNLLGTGVTLGFKYRSGVDRDEYTLNYSDRHFRGTRNRTAARLSENSDGYDRRLYYARPFFALDSRRAWGASAGWEERIESLYDRGDIVSDFEHLLRYHEVFAGFSPGLRDGWARRWFAGLVYDEHRFSAAPDTDPPDAPIQPDREYLYPYLGFEFVEDHFEEGINFDRINLVEDRFLGKRFALRLGYSGADWGSSEDAWHFRAAASDAVLDTKRSSLLLRGTVNGRYADGHGHNVRFDAGATFYRRITKNQLFYVSLSGTRGHDLDLDNPLFLGGDSGLRGYPLRYQGGDTRALLTLEHRIFTDWYPWRLFNVGAAVFFDAGRTWGDNPAGGPNLGLLRDAGVGLRLGNNRLAEGRVLHIDLAFPLDGDEDIDDVQILIDARSSF